MALELALLQKRVTNIINKIIAGGKVANAYIFAGGEGVGKKKFAETFAKSINCEQFSSELKDDCNCRVCLSVDNSSSVDFVDIYPDGNNIKVSQIRDLKNRTKYGPASCKWMFVVVNEADKMTQEAANSFLKLLEEPSPNVCFILLVTNVDAVLNTIKSRSQIISFSQLTPEYLADIIENPDISLIDIIKGEKQMYDFFQEEEAKSLLRDLDNISIDSNKYKLILLAEKIAGFNKNDVKHFINYIIMRNMRIVLELGDTGLIKEKMHIVEKCKETLKKIDYNISLKLHLESLLLSLAAVG